MAPTGVSINVTAELDQSLLARPDDLQQQIGDLYQQARDALNRQSTAPAPQRPQSNRGSRYSNSNGNGRSNGSMTTNQRGAIDAISTRLNIDPHQECRDILNAELDQLSLRQASEFIDHLRSLQPAERNRGGR